MQNRCLETDNNNTFMKQAAAFLLVISTLATIFSLLTSEPEVDEVVTGLLHSLPEVEYGTSLPLHRGVLL